MKNGEIYGISMLLNESLKVSKSGKLIYAVNRNIDAAEREIKALDAVRKPSTKYSEFNAKRIALCETNSAKDEQGRPKTIKTEAGDTYDIADKPAFEAALAVLQEEYKDALAEQTTALEQFNKLMGEEAEDFKIYKLKYSVLEKEQSELKPEARLDGVQTRAIWFMIEDDLVDNTK